MNVRDWLNNNSAVVTIVAVVVLVLALGLIVWQNTGTGVRSIEEFYYYDVGTGQLVTGPSDAVPPFQQDGSTLVRARVFACGECPGGLAGSTRDQLAQQNVDLAWLERYPEQARQALMQGRQQQDSGEAPDPRVMEMQMMAHEQLQVTKPGAEQQRWFIQMSQPGQEIMQPSVNCGEGERIRECFPGE